MPSAFNAPPPPPPPRPPQVLSPVVFMDKADPEELPIRDFRPRDTRSLQNEEDPKVGAPSGSFGEVETLEDFTEQDQISVYQDALPVQS